MFVIEVQRRRHPLGNDAGAKFSRSSFGYPSLKDQLHLPRMTEAEILMDDFLKEGSSGKRPIQNLGQSEFRLQHGNVIAVISLPILDGERVGQEAEPLPQESVNFIRGQRVAKPLQPSRVSAGEKAIVERLKGNAPLL